MKIEFELTLKNDETDVNVVSLFCNMVISNIKKEIFSNIRKSKLDIRKNEISNAPWMVWKNSAKSKDIDMMLLAKMIANGIVWKKIKDNTYVIEVSKAIKYPNSQVAIEKMARFLDRGTLNVPSMYFVNVIFNKYRKQLPKVWKSFLQIYFKRLNVDYTLTVK